VEDGRGAVPSRGLPRPLEALAAAAGLVLAAPILLAAAAAVAIGSGRPVLYRQERVGRDGRGFSLLKLRTMRPGTGPQVTAAGDARITPVGRVLRRLKLDELPQLWNVLKGEMALVGARPEVPAYVDLADPLWRQVLAGRPGLTDPVTIRLRDEEELLEAAGGDRQTFYLTTLQPWKLRGYVEYERCRTWRSDLAVLARTVVAAILPFGVRRASLAEILGDRRERGSPSSSAGASRDVTRGTA
jgi:lipopolysaccharide/colanic/teichoic acid biosynthesis glycosyltransferase